MAIDTTMHQPGLRPQSEHPNLVQDAKDILSGASGFMKSAFNSVSGIIAENRNDPLIKWGVFGIALVMGLGVGDTALNLMGLESGFLRNSGLYIGGLVFAFVAAQTILNSTEDGVGFGDAIKKTFRDVGDAFGHEDSGGLTRPLGDPDKNTEAADAGNEAKSEGNEQTSSDENVSQEQNDKRFTGGGSGLGL